MHIADRDSEPTVVEPGVALPHGRRDRALEQVRSGGVRLKLAHIDSLIDRWSILAQQAQRRHLEDSAGHPQERHDG